MPIYCYQCECGTLEDVYSSVKDMDKNIPFHCGKPMKRKIFASYVVEDIKPYQAVALDKTTGKAPVITSRKEHKEFLRRNNLVEVGNEMPKPKAKEADHNVRPELTQATHEVMRKYR